MDDATRKELDNLYKMLQKTNDDNKKLQGIVAVLHKKLQKSGTLVTRALETAKRTQREINIIRQQSR